jgi:hypothetical protein
VLKLPRPPLVEEKLLAVVDDEWRTAREIYMLFDEGELSTARSALCRLADAEGSGASESGRFREEVERPNERQMS